MRLCNKYSSINTGFTWGQTRQPSGWAAISFNTATFFFFPAREYKKGTRWFAHEFQTHTNLYSLFFSLFSTYPSKLLASEFLSLSFSLIRCSLQQSSFAVMNTQRRTAAQASSSPKSDSVTTPMTTTTTMSPLNLSPSSEQLSVQSMPVPRKQHSAPSELPAQHTLKPPSLRPKLNTILSSDASRFMSLEKLQQNMKNTNPHQERQLTIETAVFPEQQSIFNDKARRGAPQVSQALLLLLWLYICFYQRMGYTDWYICLYISYIRAMPGACAQSMMQIAINNTTNDRQANVAIDGLAARNGLLRASSRPRSLLEIWAMPFSMQMVREGGFVVEDKWIHIDMDIDIGIHRLWRIGELCVSWQPVVSIPCLTFLSVGQRKLCQTNRCWSRIIQST